MAHHSRSLEFSNCQQLPGTLGRSHSATASRGKRKISPSAENSSVIPLSRSLGSRLESKRRTATRTQDPVEGRREDPGVRAAMSEADASAGGSRAGGDPQRLKRIAAAAYDYENDARWAGYWSNVLVPPHLASRPDVVDHFKRKFYQRYIVRPPASLNLRVLSLPDWMRLSSQLDWMHLMLHLARSV